jgi:hypothetical protein
VLWSASCTITDSLPGSGHTELGCRVGRCIVPRYVPVFICVSRADFHLSPAFNLYLPVPIPVQHPSSTVWGVSIAQASPLAIADV